MTFSELRKKHPRFVYHSYQTKIVDSGLKIIHEYTIEPDIDLTAEVTIQGVTKEQWNRLPSDLQNSWAFHLGLAEMLSYWKLTASPQIVIKAGELSDEQTAWWHKLLIKGMGEYFYQNQIDFTLKDFVTWESSGHHHQVEETSLVLDKNFLVPIGGGKDSALALCIFDQIKAKQGTFQLDPIDAMTGVAAVSDQVESIIAHRQIDPKLLQMNNEGYLNGHVPFSAYLGFLARLSANLFGYQSVAISNERSSNEGNVNFLGHEINHQYSKTYEFEHDVNTYLKEHRLVPKQEAPAYFSLLRPWYELQISQVFTKCPRFDQYSRIFLSCNRGRKEGKWCGECAKCLFTFTSFYPFVTQEHLVEIFGQNLFDNLELYNESLALMGLKETKPFDCVGTHDESKVAFYMSYLQAQANLDTIPPLLEKIWKQVLSKESNLEKRAEKLITSWNAEHQVPNALESTLRTMIPISNQLTEKPVIIFGLGREGFSTYKYVRQLSKKNKIILMDQKELSELDPGWEEALKDDEHIAQCYSLEELDEIDLSGALLFKTPGVPTSHFLIKRLLNAGTKLCSNTELFFELVKNHSRTEKKPELKIIGITGTKGKSTSSTLIHHMLVEAGLEAYLGGNIGEPPLEIWRDFNLQKEHQDTVYFVLEMSSHQLAELRYSPNIAVVQHITPEHLDYYSGYDEYFEAKAQIARYQTADDIMIYNADSESATQMAARSSAQTKLTFGLDSETTTGSFKAGWLRYESEKIIQDDETPLRGKHNIYNTLPAVIIAKQLEIDTKKLVAAIKTFKPLPHRLELIAQLDGVEYYNDSIATTPKAAIAALHAFTGKNIILLVGGYERNQDYLPLAEEIVKGEVKAIVIFPPSGQRLRVELEKVGMSNQLRANIGEFSDMTEAIHFVKKRTQPGDVVLLSPAAASFGMFIDYRDRGHQFAEAVKRVG